MATQVSDDDLVVREYMATLGGALERAVDAALELAAAARAEWEAACAPEADAARDPAWWWLLGLGLALSLGWLVFLATIPIS